MAKPDRILLCFTAQPHAEALIRRAAHLATTLRAELYALYVALPGENTRRATAVADQLDRNQRLARDLGAQVTVKYDHRIAETILAYAREHQVSAIVLGTSQRTNWQRLVHGDLIQRIRTQAHEIPIHLIDTSP